MGAIAERLGRKRAYPVKAATVLSQNEPALLASGYLTPVSGGTGTSVGVTTLGADNSTGANGDVRAEVVTGEHKFVNNAADITVSMVGATAYWVDASTVSSSDDTASRPAAGKITQVDSDGVWIDIGV
uniref:hypothetical protein n=1 Tax=Marinobacterium profundum TaxID=1714300 RepID=UPI000830D80A|nr:hypothetical protein [Marinobacterium profundum]